MCTGVAHSTQWTKRAGRCLRYCMTYKNKLKFNSSEGVARFKYMDKKFIIVVCLEREMYMNIFQNNVSIQIISNYKLNDTVK